MSDNSIAIAYINKKSGFNSPECNKIAITIWLCFADRNLQVHGLGVNMQYLFQVRWCLEADRNSQKLEDGRELQLIINSSNIQLRM